MRYIEEAKQSAKITKQWFQEENNMAQYTPPKLLHYDPTMPRKGAQGQLYGVLLSTGTEIPHAFEGNIDEDLFKNQVVNFGADKKSQRINPFSSLKAFLDYLQKLSIEFKQLGEVFRVYISLVL